MADQENNNKNNDNNSTFPEETENGTGSVGSVGTAAPTTSATTIPPMEEEEEEDPIVTVVDEPGVFGYQCARVVMDNSPNELVWDFFVDLATPEGTQAIGLAYLQEQLVESIAQQFDIANGQGCDNLEFGRTWLVQILSRSNEWIVDPAIDSCKELTYNPETYDCQIYQARMTAAALTGTGRDVLDFMQTQFESGAMVRNSPYGAKFLGPVIRAEDGDGSGGSNRDNLGTPSNAENAPPAITGNNGNDDNNSVTVIGGILVAAFCLAFAGVGLILYRRRQEWLLEQQETDAEGRKYFGGGNDDADDDASNTEYQPGQLHAELYEQEDHLQMDMEGNVLRQSNDEHDNNNNDGEDDDDDNSDHNKNNGNTMTFDLGNTMKDQLMGIHSSSQQQYGNNNNNMRNNIGNHPRLSGAPMMGGVMGAPSMDYSEADSWAQTEGTIGSIEQTLEPVTAEV